MRRILFISTIFIFTAVQPILSIYPFVRNFSRTVSQSGTQNWDIVQTSNNWMYFANNNGLLEFDGKNWNIFPIGNHTNVRSLHYDAQSGRIYAGAFNEFGFYARDSRGILQYHSLMEKIAPNERSFNEVWAILQIGNRVYFQSEREIFRYENGSIRRFNFTDRIEHANVVHNLLFVSTSNNGVFTLNGDLFVQLPNSEILVNKRICAILPFQDNKVLFVSDFDGLFVFDGTAVRPKRTSVDAFLRESHVFSADISGSKLAIGTVRNGLLVKNLETNTNIFSNLYSGLQNNTVLSLKFDRQGNLWLGLDRGIDYVKINSPFYDLFGNNQLFGAGYVSLIKNNQLYLGTNQGLFVAPFPVVSSPRSPDIRLIPGMQGQVWGLQLIDNLIFAGTDQGAFIINNGRATQIAGIPGTWNFRQLNRHPGYILGSSYQGFFLLRKENGQWRFSNFVSGFYDSGSIFEEDEYGNIWFAHWMNGIQKLTFNDTLTEFTVESIDDTRGFYTNRNNVVFRINNEVIFSSDGGFFRYDPNIGRVVHASDIEDLFGIYGFAKFLHQDARGNIWYISGSVIEKASIQPDGSFKMRYWRTSMLENKLIPGFQDLTFINDSIVLVNTEFGFVQIDISELKNIRQYDFKVAIRSVYLTRDGSEQVGGFLSEQTEIPAFRFQENSIRFEFVAPEFRSSNVVMYSYLLENYDSYWSPFSAVSTKEYTRLPRGNYSFRVRAFNTITGETAETVFRFTILPPWYKTQTAIIIYSILVVLALFLLFLYTEKRSKKGVMEMKAQKEKEMQEQEAQFKVVTKEKEKEIVSLKNQKLQYELRSKSRELASSTMNLIRKNEMLLEMNRNLDKIANDLKNSTETTGVLKSLLKLQDSVKKNIERDNNWKKFEENFDMVYENYLKRLGEQFSSLTVSDKKLCAYLKMGLSSKDIAPLLNMSFRSVEMSRYRLRKKLELDRDVNLTEFLQGF